jgi:integrase
MYKNKRVKEVKAAWRRVRAAAGLDGAVQPYSLRHTVARYLRASGVLA